MQTVYANSDKFNKLVSYVDHFNLTLHDKKENYCLSQDVHNYHGFNPLLNENVTKDAFDGHL